LLFVRCRESIQRKHSGAANFEAFAIENRHIIENWLDNYYFYPQLGDIPEMVQRTLVLADLEASSTPSAQTNAYISEASRCFVQGFMLAAVAMTRAALEQAFKEAFRKLDGRETPDRNLGSLISGAERRGVILPAGLIGIAQTLNRKCNKVMHERPTATEDEAREIIFGVRALLTEIYSGMGE
jgi:hypothetical protein